MRTCGAAGDGTQPRAETPGQKVGYGWIGGLEARADHTRDIVAHWRGLKTVGRAPRQRQISPTTGGICGAGYQSAIGIIFGPSSLVLKSKVLTLIYNDADSAPSDSGPPPVEGNRQVATASPRIYAGSRKRVIGIFARTGEG